MALPHRDGRTFEVTPQQGREGALGGVPTVRQIPRGVDELAALLLQLKGSDQPGVKQRLLAHFREPGKIGIKEAPLRRRNPIVNPSPLTIVEALGSTEDHTPNVIEGCQHSGDVAGNGLPGKPLLGRSRRAAVEVDDRQAIVA